MEDLVHQPVAELAENGVDLRPGRGVEAVAEQLVEAGTRAGGLGLGDGVQLGLQRPIAGPGSGASRSATQAAAEASARSEQAAMAAWRSGSWSTTSCRSSTL